MKWWWLIMLCERIRVRQGQYIDRAGAADELGGAVAGLLAVWTFCPGEKKNPNRAGPGQQVIK